MKTVISKNMIKYKTEWLNFTYIVRHPHLLLQGQPIPRREGPPNWYKSGDEG